MHGVKITHNFVVRIFACLLWTACFPSNVTRRKICLSRNAKTEMDRRAVEVIVCQVCNERQAPMASCVKCGTIFAKYYCAECKFWDDDGEEKMIFHCEKCGICRVGGRENFFHCDTCGSCYGEAIRQNHRCVERAMHTSCPVCLEDLFNSIKAVRVLDCGHTIHQECLENLSSVFSGLQSLRCPLCSKSIGNVAGLRESIDREIENAPLPEELRRQAQIICNDCSGKGHTEFHIFGLRCLRCGSYNTRESV